MEEVELGTDRRYLVRSCIQAAEEGIVRIAVAVVVDKERSSAVVEDNFVEYPSNCVWKSLMTKYSSMMTWQIRKQSTKQQ